MLLLFAPASTMSSLDTSVVMPKRVFYLFPLGEGPAIKGREREITSRMVDNTQVDAKFMPKTSVDLKDCPPTYLCESVRLYAQEEGNVLTIKLTFSPLGRRNLHPQLHNDRTCGLRDDTFDGCLGSDLDMLADDLRTHHKEDLERLAGHSYGQ